MYFENLYEEIIAKNCKKYTHLRIIAGYASASFLEKVTSSYPHLSIDLFIGMSNEGISKKNHELFLDLQGMQNIDIYYQINKNQPTHMKIYEFYNANEKKQFVGSPNFSENGFINNREILVNVDEELDYLFDYQKNISMLCDNKAISSFIHFFDEKKKPSESHSDEVENEVDFLVQSPRKSADEARAKNSTGIPRGLKGFRRSHINYKYIKFFFSKNCTKRS